MSTAPTSKNGKSQPTPKATAASAQTVAPVANHVNGVPSGGKKKKKKKVKGKAANHAPYNTTVHDVMDEDDDDLPELEPCTAPNSFAHTRTGLSPDLESVHLSTTASLASLSATARQKDEHVFTSVNNMAAASHTEMLADLYRRVGFDAANAVEDEMRKSLDALPGMRSIVQSALAGMTGLGLGNDEEKQRTLYAIAQKMLQGSVEVGVGVGVGVGPGGRTAAQGGGKNGAAHANGAPPFDAGALSELALTQALERLVSGKGGIPKRSGAGGHTALHANVVLSHEFLDDEEGVFEDEMYSEDEVDGKHGEDGYSHMDGNGTYARGWNATVEGITYDFEEEVAPAPPGAYPPYAPAPTSGGKPKSKAKKRKKGVIPDMAGGDGDAPDVTAPSSPSLPPTIQNAQTTMPPARANPPPPSSRSAGKQPMSYAPSTPATTTNTAPPRSARAAAKAPAPPQSYANHTHTHTSPPASNGSAPQKHRPPASGGGQSQAGAANAKSNSKIWSTNTTEERERIKEFWLGLSEGERRALVKIEKETVLRRMKEQQKHSCTCAVCGRKRFVIIYVLRR